MTPDATTATLREAGPRQAPARLRLLSDERLAARLRRGDERAFDVLFERHHGKLLSFCRYLLGNRDEAEDAVQQSFLRLHGALLRERAPEEVRPFLYAVARNRCKSILAARAAVPAELDDDRPDVRGLADEVQQREELRQLVADIGRLPEEQRAALVLAELGDLRHHEIAAVLGVPEARVKALVFQAKDRLLGERDARERSCDDVREELATASGGELRRAPLRRHLKGCPSCRAYQAALGRQKAALGLVLPIAATPGLKAGLAGLLGGGGGGAAGGGGLAAGAGASGAGPALPFEPSPVVAAVHSALGQGGAAVSTAATAAAPAAGVVGGGAVGVAGTAAAGGGLLSFLGSSVAVKVAAVVAVAGGGAVGGSQVVGAVGGDPAPKAVAAPGQSGDEEPGKSGESARGGTATTARPSGVVPGRPATTPAGRSRATRPKDGKAAPAGKQRAAAKRATTKGTTTSAQRKAANAERRAAREQERAARAPSKGQDKQATRTTADKAAPVRPDGSGSSGAATGKGQDRPTAKSTTPVAVEPAPTPDGTTTLSGDETSSAGDGSTSTTP